MNKLFYVLVLITIVVISSCEKKSKINNEITLSELQEHISFLASDSLKGRKAGTTEGKIAAEYIKVQFQNYGLELLGDNGYEYFEVKTGIKLGDSNKLKVNDIEPEIGFDFMPYAFSASASHSSNVIFAGYGFDFETKQFAWNDYSGIDVSGKWVMVLKDAPRVKNYRSFSRFNDLKSKVLTAEDKGAAGVLLVSGIEYDSLDLLPELIFKRSMTKSGIPVIQITRQVADLILQENDFDIEYLESTIKSKSKPYSFVIDKVVSASVDIELQKSSTQNVLAQITGNDELLKDEFIVIGAHYDHLGMGGEGSNSRSLDTLAPHNGADDNASGVAGVIELAGKLAAIKDSLKRSVIFMAFAAEEIGLLGSKYFVNNQIIDISKVKAMINFDMIGRLDTSSKAIMVGGVGTGVESEDLLNNLNDEYGFKLKISSEGYGPSDHAAFYTKDIPVFFISTGAHADYHTIYDDEEKINYKGQLEVLNFSEDLLINLVNRPNALTFQEAGPKERKVRHGYGGIRLGIMPDFTDGEGEGLGIDAVTDPEGPAAKGGMQKGDVILAIDGKKVNGIQDYMLRLKNLQAGQNITVDIKRDGELKVLILQL